MDEIVVGRGKADLEKYGLKGTVLLGKHYITMGQTTSLSNKIYLDVAGAHVVFICGKRGSGKCLTGDTLITLNDGREIPIKDLENNDNEILALNEKLKLNSTSKDDFFKRSVSKLLKITLRSGKEIKLTPEHPLLTINGWIEAQNLENGSRIATPRHTSFFGEDSLPENTIKLLAYFITEGHLRNNFILFSNFDEKIIHDFKNCVKLFDAKLEVKQHSKEGCFRVIDLSQKRKINEEKRNLKGQFEKGVMFDKQNSLRKYFESLNMYGKLAIEREIPELIFKLPKTQLALFINRLFSCDGSINKSKSWSISYASSSKILISQVQSLLLKFGILSKTRLKHIEDKLSYELEIQAGFHYKFIQEIGFFGEKEERQKIALKEISKINNNPNVDTIPKEIWDKYRPSNWVNAGKALGYSTSKAARSSIAYSPSRQKLLTISIADQSEEIQLLAQSDIFWDEIKSIENLSGSFEVYDISVPENHNFVANGIIVHNSYTMGTIAEGFYLLDEDVKKNLSVVLLDTMGIYWTMKYPNHEDKLLLEEWGLKPQSIPIRIFTPEKYYHIYKEKGIPTDVPFTLAPFEIDQDDWCNAFKIDKYSSEGILISDTILSLKESGAKYSMDDIIKTIKNNQESEKKVKDAVVSMFKIANSWGVFSDHGTLLSELAKAGQIAVLDVSCYATMPGGWDVKALIVGLVSQRLFINRMEARKGEEFEAVSSATNFFSKEGPKKQDMPLVWLVIDEAHEFLPNQGKVASTDALVTIMREGRQPGISLILATQQPGKIHTDVMTQSDTVLSHRITAKIDVDALGLLMQSYMRTGLVAETDKLPRVKGSGILFDDNNEKMYPMRVKPRFTWHGGSSPSAITDEKENKEENDLI